MRGLALLYFYKKKNYQIKGGGEKGEFKLNWNVAIGYYQVGNREV